MRVCNSKSVTTRKPPPSTKKRKELAVAFTGRACTEKLETGCKSENRAWVQPFYRGSQDKNYPPESTKCTFVVHSAVAKSNLNGIISFVSF